VAIIATLIPAGLFLLASAIVAVNAAVDSDIGCS